MASTPNSIATLVIGPQAGGRGYRVLARSAGPAIAGSAEGRLSELALVLAGWADEKEAPAVALLPLGDATTPALLMRIAYLGTAPLGTIAYANGLILDEAAFALCAGRPESLLPLIPPPDGSRQFAEAPIQVQDLPQPSPPRRDWNGLGLEWRDRLVLVDDIAQEEPTLCSILRSIGPAGPGARVRGWATTALLPSSGSFSPARELQLLVVEFGRRRPGGLHYLPAHATPTGFDGDRVTDLPPAAQAWERLKSVGGLDVDLSEAIGPLRWSPAYLDASPTDIIGPAATEALRRLSGGAAQMRFVLELARPRGDGLDQDFADVARGLFAQLVGRAPLDPQHAAFYIKTLADAPQDVTDTMRLLGPLLLKPGSARWLRGATFDRLLQLGYAEALAEHADDAPAIIHGLGAEALLTLLQRLLATHSAPSLISAALRELADQTGDEGPPPNWRDTFASALRWRFERPAGPDERLLASRSVVRATSRLVPAFMPHLSRRALRLRDAGGLTARERLDMLAGALEWVRFQGAAT
jgi:hypothetical protein